MNKKLYKNYVDDIAHYLKKEKNKTFQKSFERFNVKNNFSDTATMLWHDKTKNEADFRSLSALNSITMDTVKYEEKLGSHPSFSHLKNTDKSENHYIVSMFIDVKNSTGLFKKYEPEVVANICGTIQLAAIHTCWYFDGYIHRLQGDGLMVYFGGMGITKKVAVDNALMASSFISYFLKNDLKDLFEEQGVDRIYTRIGIDFGDSDVTLWHNAGIGGSSEVTTTSLHTSLASKMQAQAQNNGIVVGDNILKFKPNHTSYFTHKKYNNNGGDHEYIYEIREESFRYKQHDFNWERYLENHPSIEQNPDGSLAFIGSPILPNPQVQQNINYLQENVTNYKPYLK